MQVQLAPRERDGVGVQVGKVRGGLQLDFAVVGGLHSLSCLFFSCLGYVWLCRAPPPFVVSIGLSRGRLDSYRISSGWSRSARGRGGSSRSGGDGHLVLLPEAETILSPKP